MNPRYSFDEQRGLPMIHHDPAARDVMSPDEVKQWMASGTRPNTYDHEPDRCPTCGLPENCVCSNCRFCVDGVPCVERWHPAEQRRWGRREQQGTDRSYQEMDDS